MPAPSDHTHKWAGVYVHMHAHVYTHTHTASTIVPTPLPRISTSPGNHGLGAQILMKSNVGAPGWLGGLSLGLQLGS